MGIRLAALQSSGAFGPLPAEITGNPGVCFYIRAEKGGSAVAWENNMDKKEKNGRTGKTGTEKKKRTGIMGGTFNPIHIGHLLLAESAGDSFGLDEILFIPSGRPYMKREAEVLDRKVRYEMTRLGIEDNPAFSVSDIEVKRKGNTYTCDTLLLLGQQEPETEFYFIVGADSLFSMETWRNPEYIFKNCTILAAIRDDKDSGRLAEQIACLEEKFAANICQITFKEVDISSTDIRMRLAGGQSIRYMVPDKVISYIEKTGYIPGRKRNRDKQPLPKQSGALPGMFLDSHCPAGCWRYQGRG